MLHIERGGNMADYISLILALSTVVFTFCFMAWLFEEQYFRWLFAVLANVFLIILVNVGREIAELNSLTDIESLFIVSSWSLIFINLLFLSVFMILFLVEAFKYLISSYRKKAGYPDDD